MTNKPSPNYDHLLHHTNPHLQAAAETQNLLGWDNFLKMRFALAWKNCYEFEHSNTPNKHFTSWIRALSQWSWDFFSTTWEARNRLIFGENNKHHSTIQKARMASMIKETYEACTQLPEGQQNHIQHKSLDNLISKTHILTLWLTQAQQLLREHRKSVTKSLPQTLITQFFAVRQPNQ